MILSRVFSLFIFLAAISPMGNAQSHLPKNLDTADQIRLVEVLGFGSANKVLGNPYPLGGYSGIEIGLSTEYIPLSDVSKLGNGSADDGFFNYYTFSLGKGFYYNIDTFVFFTPFLQNQKFQSFGAQARWGFYQVETFPLSFSLVVGTGGANYSNLLNVTTLSTDILATFNSKSLALYAGAGFARAIGRFTGDSESLTDDLLTAERDIIKTHYVGGISVQLSKFFVAAEVDYYADTIYSGKMGFRF